MASNFKKLELPNEIKTMEDIETFLVLLSQNLDAIVAAHNLIINYINEYASSAIEGNTEFETNAITYGTEEPTD